MQKLERLARVGMVWMAATIGCGSQSADGSGDAPLDDSGTSVPAADAASSGGARGTGGTTAKGGATGSGGTTAKGGGAGSGGTTGTGGTTGSGGATGTGGTTKAPPPPDTCIQDNTCTPGVWVNVTPPEIDLSDNYGSGSVEVDPMRPQDLYATLGNLGVWRSTDYGRTWTPGSDAVSAATLKTARTCGGYIRIPKNSTTNPPLIYFSTMGCDKYAFWRSTDGGATWVGSDVSSNAIPTSNNTFYAPSVDPYDTNHLIMAGHLVDLIVESTDGGNTWKTAPIDPGMKGGTVFALSFLDTGNPATSRSTWLSISTAWGPGTWRTENAGASWTKVSENTHNPGATQIYQPKTDPSVVYMAGIATNTSPGGVFRSSDNGKTWKAVGKSNGAKIVFGTDKAIYSLNGAVAQTGSQCTTPHSCWWPYLFQSGAQPGTGTWTSLTTPDAMTQGPTWGAATSDGTHGVLVTANYGAGLWRYVEP